MEIYIKLLYSLYFLLQLINLVKSQYDLRLVKIFPSCFFGIYIGSNVKIKRDKDLDLTLDKTLDFINSNEYGNIFFMSYLQKYNNAIKILTKSITQWSAKFKPHCYVFHYFYPNHVDMYYLFDTFGRIPKVGQYFIAILKNAIDSQICRTSIQIFLTRLGRAQYFDLKLFFYEFGTYNEVYAYSHFSKSFQGVVRIPVHRIKSPIDLDTIYEIELNHRDKKPILSYYGENLKTFDINICADLRHSICTPQDSIQIILANFYNFSASPGFKMEDLVGNGTVTNIYPVTSDGAINIYGRVYFYYTLEPKFIIYCKHTESFLSQINWSILFDPFKLHVWILLLISFVALSFTHWIKYKRTINLAIFGHLSRQCSADVSHLNWLLMIGIFMAFFVNSIYEIKVTSDLTVRKDPPITNFVQLLKMDYKFIWLSFENLLSSEFRFILLKDFGFKVPEKKETFLYLNPKTDSKLLSIFSFYTNYYEPTYQLNDTQKFVYEKLSGSNSGKHMRIIDGGKSFLPLHLFNLKNEYCTIKSNCICKSTQEPIFFKNMAWIFHGIYRLKFLEKFGQIFESGIVNRVYDTQAFLSNVKAKYSTHIPFAQLSIDSHAFVAICFLSIGCTISILIFFIEISIKEFKDGYYNVKEMYLEHLRKLEILKNLKKTNTLVILVKPFNNDQRENND